MHLELRCIYNDIIYHVCFGRKALLIRFTYDFTDFMLKKGIKKNMQ